MITDRTPKVYLSRRNLLTLLSKLDRDAKGEQTECTLIKYKQPGKGVSYQQTMDRIAVIAVQDEEYYPAQERSAGYIHESDEAQAAKPSAAIIEEMKSLAE